MVLEINVQINDHAVVTGLNRKASQIPAYMNRFKQDILDIAHRWVQREAPRRKTGRTKAAVQKKQQGNVGIIFRNKHIAPWIDWVIDGRPGFSAKNAKALRFEIDGKTIFRKSVGPAKSNPFFDRAYPRISSDIDRRVQALEKWLTEI